MKAVRMYAPGDLRVEDIPIPEINENEALVKVMAVGVCGSDIPRANVYGAYISPITLGHEFAGQIEKTGKNVKEFSVGDRVTVPPLIPCYKCEWCELGEYGLCVDYSYYGSRCEGAMADYIAVNKNNLLRVYDGISYEDAATTDPCANALHGMMRADFKAGDSVCVYGAGPIGLFAIQYARIKGASKIVAVDTLPEKLTLAEKCGAHVTFNSSNGSVASQVKEVTNGGANIVLDMTGVPVAQKDCIHCVSKLGKVILLGISHKGLDLSEKEVDLIMREQLDIRGSWNSFTKPFPGSDWVNSLELMKNGLTARDIISHRLTLDEAPGIFSDIKNKSFFFSKIMFYPWGIKAGKEDS